MITKKTAKKIDAGVSKALKGKKTYAGKSTKLGYGGRSAYLKAKLTAKGLPASEVGGIIGKIARAKKAAPGMKNYHGKRKAK